MSTKDFVLALARGARGKDAAKALILPQIFGGTGYVNAGTELTVSGTPPLSLPNSLGKPLKAWEVDVLPKQDLNGYDAPWPAGGGANQFDAITWATLGANPNYYTVSADETITVSEFDVGGISNRLFNVEASATYSVLATTFTNIRVFDSSANTIQQGTHGTFTAPEDGKIAVKFYGTSYPVSGKFILVKSSTVPSAWSPYSNLCPIYGTDKLNLFVEESYDQSATPKAVLTLPQTVYTGTIGSEGGESRWGEVDLGTLTWTYVSAYSFFTAYNDQYKSVGTGTVPNIMCECYKPASMNQIYGAGDKLIGCGTTGNYAGRFVIKDTDYTDATSFKASLTGRKLVFELTTPTTFAVPSSTIPTPTGSATTWATAEDGTVDSMSVTYIGKASS